MGIYRKLAVGKPGTFLLESAEQGGIWSRFSFVGVSSFGVLTQSADAATWLDYGLSADRALGADHPAGPLDAIAHLYERWSTPRVDGHPPLTGGLVGFIGWEAIRQIERLPDAPPADFAVPGQALSFVSELVVLDHRFGTVMLIVAALNDGLETPDALWAAAAGATRRDAARAEPAERGVARRPSTCSIEPDTDPARNSRRLHRGRRALEEVHPRRRRLPSRRLAAFRSRNHGRSDRRLSRAANAQPAPVHVPVVARRSGRRAVLDRRVVRPKLS